MTVCFFRIEFEIDKGGWCTSQSQDSHKCLQFILFYFFAKILLKVSEGVFYQQQKKYLEV